MKIVFAGTTPFSAFHLDLLIKSKNEVAMEIDVQVKALVTANAGTAVDAATEDYFSEQNVFAHWLDQHCRVEPANSYQFSTSRELFES